MTGQEGWNAGGRGETQKQLLEPLPPPADWRAMHAAPTLRQHGRGDDRFRRAQPTPSNQTGKASRFVVPACSAIARRPASMAHGRRPHGVPTIAGSSPTPRPASYGAS
eukprot:360291-Chlamydomonas_euryale.AAC.3